MTIGRFENPFAGQLCELHGHQQTTRVVVVRVSPAHKFLVIRLGLFGFDQVNQTASASEHASSVRQLNLLPLPHQSGPAGRHSHDNTQSTQPRQSPSTAITNSTRQLPKSTLHENLTNPTTDRTPRSLAVPTRAINSRTGSGGQSSPGHLVCMPRSIASAR